VFVLCRPDEVEPPAEPASRIPSSWIKGVDHLSQCRPSPDIPAHRWLQFLTDCYKFLGAGGWAESASASGWDALALFDCGLHRPLVHCGAAGLLWAIAGGRLVELHRDWAVIELGRSALWTVGVLASQTGMARGWPTAGGAVGRGAESGCSTAAGGEPRAALKPMTFMNEAPSLR
jgi:hypothetical protein